MSTTVIAGVQATPAMLDRDATVGIVVQKTREAAALGARIIVFPEAFVPGYPDWVWRTTPWADGEADWYVRLVDSAVSVPSDATGAIGAAAAEANAYVAVGIDELGDSGHSLYNTLLFFGPHGELLGKHRKIMPTGGERIIWGAGDGSGLRTYPTEFGRLGGLICWENYMPLARAALYAEGVGIYVAPTWDNSPEWPSTMRHIAKEGRCFVVGVTPFLRGSDMPDEIPGARDIYGGDDDVMSPGNTMIVAPGGEVLAGPLTGEEGIVAAEIDPSLLARSRHQFDSGGHYARPDILQLTVDRSERPIASFIDEGEQSVDDPGNDDDV